MSATDLLGSMKIIINIPLDEPIPPNDFESEDNSYLEKLITQQVLRYIGSKLIDMGSNVSINYDADIKKSYSESIGQMADLFISLLVKIKPEIDQSVAIARYFQEESLNSISLANCLVYRFNKTKWFAKSISKEENPVISIEESVPSMLPAICIGNDLFCKYNLNPDEFLSEIIDMIFYALNDAYYESENHLSIGEDD